jgi:hypothetical protein
MQTLDGTVRLCEMPGKRYTGHGISSPDVDKLANPAILGAAASDFLASSAP